MRIIVHIALFLFLFSEPLFAQNVGINNSGATPDATAILDVSATDKGVLIPRVALTGATDALTIPAPTTSLIIYNTATAGVAPDGVTPGYYHWNGTRWVRHVDLVIERWVYPPLNINANTTYTLTALITGCTSSSTATVNLYGDWATAPTVRIHHVEAMTGAVRFVIQNTSLVTTYLGMDFIITTIR